MTNIENTIPVVKLECYHIEHVECNVQIMTVITHVKYVINISIAINNTPTHRDSLVSLYCIIIILKLYAVVFTRRRISTSALVLYFKLRDLWHLCHVWFWSCSFFIGKHSATCPMHKEFASRLAIYSLHECCIFPYRTQRNTVFLSSSWELHSKQNRFFRRNPSVLLTCSPRRTLAGFSWGCMLIVLKGSFWRTYIV